jgi:flagellar basal body-associated protein FliL
MVEKDRHMKGALLLLVLAAYLAVVSAACVGATVWMLRG